MVTWRDKDGVERTEERPGPRRIKALRDGMRRRTRDLAKLHWYAFMVRAGTERAVEALLERRGLLAVVPMRKRWRKVNRHTVKKHAVSYPLAARYVFVGFEPQQLVRGAPPWAMVFGITMVQSVVGVGEVPWQMDGTKVAKFLKENLDIEAGAGEVHMAAGHEFAEGDIVEVMEGAFVGFSGPVSEIRGEHAILLLKLFGRENEIAVPIANLEPVA